MYYARELSDGFGGRLPGSRNYQQAAEWAASRFRAAGTQKRAPGDTYYFQRYTALLRSYQLLKEAGAFCKLLLTGDKDGHTNPTGHK